MNPTDPFVTFSIVSHGQGALVDALLTDLHTLQPIPGGHEILLTFNIPEDESFLARHRELPLHTMRNAEVRGFGANHNAAFARALGRIFVVLNPDLRAPQLDMGPVLAALREQRAGACGPRVLSAQGTLEDSARRFPSWGRLARRVLLRQRAPDYVPDGTVQTVDWVAGMFVAFNAQAFCQVGGYDERYFMYMEDVDICRRLRHQGWPTVWQTKCSVVHDARRASHRSLQHLRWHLSSALRFLCDDAHS